MSLKRGPKRHFDYEKLETIFENNKNVIIRSDGGVAVPTDRIWASLKRKHQIPMTEKAIYTNCLKWNKQLKKDSKELKSEISDSGMSYEEELNSSLNELSLNDSDYVDDAEKSDESDIKFSITLPNVVWKTIEPISKEYHRAADDTHKSGDRIYNVLKPGVWTSVFIDKIAEHPKKIECTWSFKKAQVSTTAKYYVGILAKCTTCDSILIGFLQNKPQENESVVFKFVIKKFDATKHDNVEKQVKVTGAQAKALATSTKTAVALHRQMSARSGEIFEKGRGRVPSAAAIRNLQSRERQKHKLSPDVFKSLFYLQNSPKYANIIHLIGYSPFYVFYGSPNQYRLYNMYLKKNTVSKVSCDATGGVVRKIGNKLFQLLSHTHTNELAHWLRRNKMTKLTMKMNLKNSKNVQCRVVC